MKKKQNKPTKESFVSDDHVTKACIDNMTLDSLEGIFSLYSLNSTIGSECNNAYELARKGWIAFSLRLYDIAAIFLDKAIAADLRYANAYIARGMAAYMAFNSTKEDIQTGIKFFEKAIELGVNVELAYYHMGHAYSGLYDHRKALECYSKAIDVNPDFAWAYVAKAGNPEISYDEAYDLYDCATNLIPNSFTIWYEKGNLCHETNKYKLALECYDKCLDIKPTDMYLIERVKDAFRSFSYALNVLYHNNEDKEWFKAFQEKHKHLWE